MNVPTFPNPYSQGFTSIGLPAAIGVIGILAAILIPAGSKVRSRTPMSESVAQLRRIGIAFSLSAQEQGREGR